MCTLSLDTVNTKKNAKENISVKSVSISMNAVTSKAVKRDILKDVENMHLDTPANLNMTVLTLIQSQLKVKRRIC